MASRLLGDPVAAHEIIFADSHANKSAPFHEEMVTAFHSDNEYEIFLCFRGSSKSTKAEETIALRAAAGLIHNCVVVGDSYTRATDRLKTIRRHLASNKWIRYLFSDRAGEIQGDTWTEGKIELSSGCLVWSLGQGQAVLGTKHGAYRPDYAFADDLEDAETAATELSRAKLADWWWSEFLPALAPKGERRVRMAATPWHPKALAVQLSKHPAWVSHTIPIEYIDELGNRVAAWPDRFPLHIIDEMKDQFIIAGKARNYAMQYQVEAVNPELQLFKEENFLVEPRVRTWEPVYLAYDPARTTKDTSATTGIVAASYIGRKLVVWEARGVRIPPSEIVSDIFRLEQKYEPISIGVEKDGLEEFLMEPIRHEQMKRGVLLPVVPLQAPRRRGGDTKDDFITKLQPFYVQGEIIFAGQEADFREARSQILSFPVGDKDILNALAYIPQLRGGEPVYTDMTADNIADTELTPVGSYTLAVNAGSHGTTAALFQYAHKTMLIHRDWVSGAPPGEALSSIIQEARLETGKNPLVVIPPFHFDVRNSYGLLAALRGVSEGRKGGDIIRGREFLRELLRGEARGAPRLLLAAPATWTRRAMSGGFVWLAGHTEAREGLYRTLMEGLEAAVAPAAYAKPGATQATARTEEGVQYNTADPHAQGGYMPDPKADLLEVQRQVFEALRRS